jgi:hypothetical protein
MLSILLGLCLSQPAIAGEVRIDVAALPASVKATIAAKYVGGTTAAASREKIKGVDRYEATVHIGTRSLDLAFATDGTVIEEEEVIPLTSAPAPVQAALKARYGSWTVSRVERAVTRTQTVFDAALKKGTSTQEVVLDSNGAPITEREAEEEEGESEGDEAAEKR